jgi:16S rRNA (guanine966-N2)-methyltransferase
VTRIVGGTAGGRRLAVPKGRGTRPTAERTREALFSTLESIHGSLRDVAFLDLFAGSGAVGLEAASRGAASVLLVERDAGALVTLRANAAAVGLPGVDVRGEAVARLLAEPPSVGYDVVFLDPPYDAPVEDVLAGLVGHDWLALDGTVVVERASRSDPPEWPAGLVLDRSRRYGDTTLWYGRRS